ncbi:MAG: rRNA methyltransferase, partial [Opitutaceae bacterium]
MLLTCQSGFETLLGRELADAGAPAVEQGPGWVRTDIAVATEGLAFPWLTLRDPSEVKGESVNALATRVAEFFLASLRGERIEAAWPSVWLGPQETVGLGRRLSAVE